MKISILLIALSAWSVSNASVRAGEFDGRKPFICSLTQVFVCERNGEIEKDTAEQVNLPQFFFIDVEKRVVKAKGPSGDARESAIEAVRHEDGALILEGVQLGKAWHAVINEETGKATLTGATADRAFVIFAACTPGSAAPAPVENP